MFYVSVGPWKKFKKLENGSLEKILVKNEQRIFKKYILKSQSENSRMNF